MFDISYGFALQQIRIQREPRGGCRIFSPQAHGQSIIAHKLMDHKGPTMDTKVRNMDRGPTHGSLRSELMQWCIV